MNSNVSITETSSEFRQTEIEDSMKPNIILETDNSMNIKKDFNICPKGHQMTLQVGPVG